MKYIKNPILFVILVSIPFIDKPLHCQTPQSDELIVLNSVSNNTEMNTIQNPSEGSLVYNQSDDSIYIRTGTEWTKLIQEESKTIILNRSGGSLPTQTNRFFDLPLTNGNLQTINTNYYNLTDTAEITILQTGNYLISGELSVRNMPSGNTKFILGVFINGQRRGYLSRGSASLDSRDFWGTTGTLMYRLNQNDRVNISYVINAGGNTLDADFTNIGITKI